MMGEAGAKNWGINVVDDDGAWGAIRCPHEVERLDLTGTFTTTGAFHDLKRLLAHPVVRVDRRHQDDAPGR